MAAYPVQFSYNRVPFSSMEEALKALRAKNILPGEPAVAYYKDASYGQSALVAVGDTFLDDLKSKGYTVTSLANQNY